MLSVFKEEIKESNLEDEKNLRAITNKEIVEFEKDVRHFYKKYKIHLINNKLTSQPSYFGNAKESNWKTISGTLNPNVLI